MFPKLTLLHTVSFGAVHSSSALKAHIPGAALCKDELWSHALGMTAYCPLWKIQMQSIYQIPKPRKRRSTSLVLCCCSVVQSCPTLCEPVDYSTLGLLVHSSLLELAHSCPLSWWWHPTISSSVTLFLQSFPASESFAMSWLFTQIAKVLELQPQNQSFQWIFRIDFL